jgi:hypothetical protein
MIKSIKAQSEELKAMMPMQLPQKYITVFWITKKSKPA